MRRLTVPKSNVAIFDPELSIHNFCEATMTIKDSI